MKYPLIYALFFCFFLTSTNAQQVRINPHAIDSSSWIPSEIVDQSSLVNDTSYDVKFYHLDVEIGLFSPSIKGSVQYLIQSNKDGLENIKLDLDKAFQIDSISSPAASYDFSDNALSIQFNQTYDEGALISFAVYYHGTPPLAGGYKGLRYETHDGGEPIVASLSTPYLAHTWWPCKDGVSDKADSTFY